MHEMSICESILSIIEDQATAESFSKVNCVRLEVGPLAGVELEALHFSFDVVARGGIADGASLEVIETLAKGWCPLCLKSVPVKERYDPCPTCGNYQIRITGGEELRIKNLEVV
jgi:hydrogenase nickel incorporation protein HypA/HybF